MSFGKTKVPRFSEIKENPSRSDFLKRAVSRTSVSSQRPFKPPTLKSTQRSQSLNRSTKCAVSSKTNIMTTSMERSNIPNQKAKTTGLLSNKDDVKKNTFKVDDKTDKKRILKPTKSTISSALSSPTRSVANHAILRVLPPKGLVGVQSSPNAAKRPSVIPHAKSPASIQQSVIPKAALLSSIKENISLKTKKDVTVPAEITFSACTPKNLIEKSPTSEEEIENNIKYSECSEKEFTTSVSTQLEKPNNLQTFESLLLVLSKESMSFCSQMVDNRANLLTNFINNKVELTKDDLQDEKIANYLEEGDGFHLKRDLLKNSQKGATEKILNMAKDMTSEIALLKKLKRDFELKFELLETENKDMINQIKVFSEELESEKQKTAGLNQRRTQLEQQVRKYSQRVKELDEKSQNNDEQISNQCAQLKAFEIQLKQKEEKYHTLEQRFNQQAKQCRTMVEVREKLENQRESLEIRVNDLKKLKNDLENENIKQMESLRNELNEALQSLEGEKIQRINLEKELKETQERLMQVQEKSLELADVTEFSKAALISEGSLTASEKEANLFMKLKEVQSNFEKAGEKIENLEEENEKLRTAVFQYMEQTTESKDNKVGASLIKILKSELNSKEETIEKLQKEIADYLKGVEERDLCIKELRQKRSEQSGEGNKSDVTNAEEALWIEIHHLRQRLEDGKSLNENLEHQLAQKQLEVEQRDRIMREQAKVLQVRDELLKLLRQKDKAKTGRMTALQAKLEDHERNADTVCKYFSAKSEQLQELYSTLEMKQRKVMQLEEQVKQMEVQQERGQCQRTHLEARIAELELALHEKTYLPPTCVLSCSHLEKSLKKQGKHKNWLHHEHMIKHNC